jgi:hypothetical protein
MHFFFLILVGCFVIAGAIGYWFWTRWLHTATVTVENGSIKFTETPLFANGSTTTIPCDALDEVRVDQRTLSLVKGPSRHRATGASSDQWKFWVAGGLGNNAEAEWIADRIRDAARQQTASA